MKKIYILIAVWLLSITMLPAQSPANRTVKTITADVLAQMPAAGQTAYNKLINDLASTGEEGMLLLVNMLNAPGQGSNANVEYALSGLTHFAMEQGKENIRLTVSKGYMKALETVNEPETKAFIIRQLQCLGKDECVETLATYLSDERLGGPAARALSSIRSVKSGQTLLAALKQKQGTPATQKNIIQAIGELQVEGAEEVLMAWASSAGENMQKELYYALSRVGTEKSFPLLYEAASKTGYTADKAGATDAYIALIKRVAQSGQVKSAEKEAGKLLKKASKAGRTQTRIAALGILFTLKGETSGNLLAQALKDPCKEYRNAALNNASPYAGQEMYTKLAKTMLKAKPELKTDLLNWFGREAKQPAKHDKIKNLSITSGLSFAQALEKELATVGVFPIQEAAAWTMVKIGNETFVPALVNLLGSADKQTVQLGQATLAAFPGNIDAEIARALPSATDNGKIAALQLLALRKATNQLTAVLEQIKSTSPEVKTAAYITLKDVVSERDFTLLCDMLETAPVAAIPSVQQALIAALSPLPAAEQSRIILNRMAQTGDTKKPAYYTVLASTGQPEAITTIVKAFREGNDSQREAAFQALLNSKDMKSADQLLAICKSNPSSGYFNPALSAYVKIVSNPAFTGEIRLNRLYKAMEIAKTDPQKISILRQIEKTGTYSAMMYAGKYLEQEPVRQAAANAVMNIALNHKEYTGASVRALLNKVMEVIDNPDARYQKEAIRKHLAEMPADEAKEPFKLSAEEIKEGFEILFDGTHMNEWTGNTVDYTLKDGYITLIPSKSFGGNLYTKKEYANFIYRFEFQLTPGANNGVGIRTPMEGDAAYVGMEIQILDCEHPIYKNITPMQHHGSVYGIIPAVPDHHKAFKPVGEWNTEEIMADGDHIRVTVNGIVILDGNIRKATQNGTADHKKHPGLFNKKGHIGFLGHGSPVKFRNIRIKELK